MVIIGTLEKYHLKSPNLETIAIHVLVYIWPIFILYINFFINKIELIQYILFMTYFFPPLNNLLWLLWMSLNNPHHYYFHATR